MNVDCKTCSRCGEIKLVTEFHADKGKRDGRSGRCKVCARTVAAQWRNENPERNQEYAAQWAANNKDKARAYKRAYSKKYREREAQRLANYRINNADVAAERGRRWYQENSDLTKCRARTWKVENLERYREVNKAKEHRRRARKANAEGNHTAEDIVRQCKAQHGKCYYCGVKVGDKYHADHVIPLSRGGSNGPENIVIACPSCNTSKGNKLPHEWAKGNRLL